MGAPRFAKPLVCLLAGAALSTLLAGCAGDGGERAAAPKPQPGHSSSAVTDQASPAPCPAEHDPGDWRVSPAAAWLRRVFERARYPLEGETGSALVTCTQGGDLFVWTTPAERPVEAMAEPGMTGGSGDSPAWELRAAGAGRVRATT